MKLKFKEPKLTLKDHSISTIKQYKALPKKEREKFGLYLAPYAMELNLEDFLDKESGGGWNAFYRYVKKEYPVQYFVREILIDGTRSKIEKFLGHYGETRFSKFKARFFNDRQKWLRKTIPYTWCDKPELLREICFAFVVDFIEREKCFEVTAWDDDINDDEAWGESMPMNIRQEYIDRKRPTKEFLEFAYNYITKERKELDSQIKNLYKEDLNRKERFKQVTEIENQIDKKDQEVIEGVAKHRMELWT